MTNNDQDLQVVAPSLAVRYALELHAALQELDSDYQARIADAKWPKSLELLKEYCLERFDHHGQAFLFTSVSSDPASINPQYAQ